ncbi:putative phage abortive infection protein [Tenacibaculum finnmarkense genomovar finnmarkense]|uniref:putative phage abortive infection protein n=1 Tax=Tenacibaculum finnmarkense TaxID=2781243 RepID=UPI001E4C7FE9|nr:putative phage abortive infection protein [Tenacibaculum finnmarkense]MCD8418536.1 putative phage abortive infection protein [Tenacibaculum finnmarkense genomovar finnmarkense]MCG8186894.1 putative phage abortive infection protein [Tenacibaculum finnmarkense genomovar finnmarkense]MCG8203408.1 putative phage abortive infection protein [Tenacibaculum finnmarkense genomovar finnmarkense]MCG8210893.1 putative phage abortive infection protein [Tenacibaculum finnmarkense genomovar finnmarkense]M
MEKQKEEKNYSILIISIIAVILIFSSWYYTYKQLIILPNDARGTFGDMFGSINALYSGLAFAGIIVTILLQRQELKSQRQELKQTRKEFEIQNETLKLQRFENTFFNLLSLHHQIVDSIDLDIEKRKSSSITAQAILMKRSLGESTSQDYDRIIIKGRDVFKRRYESLKHHLSTTSNLDLVNKTYLEVYDVVQTDFGHYFRNLYRMVKLVDNSTFSSNENEDFNKKYEYTSIIRSQLSDYELLWLFYNCLSSNGIEKFKKLIEKYSLLKNVPINRLHIEGFHNHYESLK